MAEALIREAVAVFQDEASLQGAVAALRDAGFGPDKVALLASCETVEKKLGHRFRKVSELEDNLVAPRVAYLPVEEATENFLIGALTYVAASFGLILASSSGLAPMIVAATAAGGAVASVGEALKWLAGHEHGRAYEEQLKWGGLLWVRVDNDRDASMAVELLRRHAGSDVHLHTLNASAQLPTAPR